MHPLWAGHKECLLTFKSLDSAALKLQQFTAGKLRGEQSYIPGGRALFQKQTPCGNPLVQQGLLLVRHWVKVERHPKAETSMSLLGPGSQRMEQEKRCSRFPQLLPPQHPRVGQGCSASGPCLPGDRTAAAPASVHPTPHRELELLPPSLLTLPSFPTPSSSALSLSVIKRIEVEMNSQILSLQLFPLSVLAPAHPFVPGCNKLSYSPSISPAPGTVTTSNLPPPTHTEKTSKSSWRYLCQGKNAPGHEGYSQRKI